MKELKTLLNSLIKLGWKPFGNNIVKVGDSEDGTKFYLKYGRYSKIFFEASLRALVSIESGLWQFCVENKLTYRNLDLRTNGGSGQEFDWYDYEYQLVESALVPEEELQEFLVRNINIEGGL